MVVVGTGAVTFGPGPAVVGADGPVVVVAPGTVVEVVDVSRWSRSSRSRSSRWSGWCWPPGPARCRSAMAGASKWTRRRPRQGLGHEPAEDVGRHRAAGHLLDPVDVGHRAGRRRLAHPDRGGELGGVPDEPGVGVVGRRPGLAGHVVAEPGQRPGPGQHHLAQAVGHHVGLRPGQDLLGRLLLGGDDLTGAVLDRQDRCEAG